MRREGSERNLYRETCWKQAEGGQRQLCQIMGVVAGIVVMNSTEMLLPLVFAMRVILYVAPVLYVEAAPIITAGSDPAMAAPT